MALKTLEVEYIEVPGVNTPVRSEVAYREKDLFKTQLYAQDNGLVVLDSPDVNTIADFLRSEDPDPEWMKQQAEKLQVRKRTLEDAYATFHGHVWEKYWIRSGEILAWPPYSERIVNPKLNRKSDKPVLLRDYEILERSEGDYVIKDGEIVEVDWPREDGTIPKNLAQLLNAKDNTYVWTNPDPEWYEGLRALDWVFRLHERPGLSSGWDPWGSDFVGGSLLGRSADEDFVMISRTQYQELIGFNEEFRYLSEKFQRLLSELHE